MIGAGPILYGSKGGAPAGFINVAGARNGLSVDSSNYVVLGQEMGAVGDPAQLTDTRVIPFANQTLQLGQATDGPFSLMIMQIPALIYEDMGLSAVVLTIQPTSNITTDGEVGQFFSNLGITQTYNYTNAASTGWVNDFAAASSSNISAGGVNYAGFIAQAFNTSAGGTGDFVDFMSMSVYDGANTGAVRGFYHNPQIIFITGDHIAFENTTGSCRLCSTIAGANTGGVAIRKGSADPTAFLHLGAGLASAGNSPLKFDAGTLLTVVENGAMEFDGTHLYITIAGTRHIII